MYSITAWSKLRAGLMQADSMTMTTESQLASSVLMIRPARFQSNPQTADSNAFQTEPDATPAEQQRAALAEFEGLVAALRDAGIEVIVFDDTTLALPLAGVIDMDAERQRLEKEVEKARKEIAKIDGKLANPNFVARAPEEVVEENRERKHEFEGQITRFEAALKRLEAAA